MRVGYIGNFEPPYSTENDIAKAIRHLGHDLRTLQENEVGNWRWLADSRAEWNFDVILWTRTGWNWLQHGCTPVEAHAMQRAMLEKARADGIPTVGYHLDRWWGLVRQHEVSREPFFGVELLVTADGGHDEEWKKAGVNHLWMPPAVNEFECVPGNFTPSFASDVAFVGSWMEYHPEWSHRPQLVDQLRSRFNGRVKFFPERGQPGVRGPELRDLYASTKVNVGDSCLVGDAMCYWSDRVPETIGRGGFLLHPFVPGLEEHFEVGTHLKCWQLWDWEDMARKVEYYLEHDAERQYIAKAGRDHVLANHTYTVRMKRVLELVRP